jgi:hypothetical protein
MSNLFIRGIDHDLATILKQQARESGKSVNQFVLDVLKDYASHHKKLFIQEYHDLDFLFGRWTDGELNSIQTRIDNESQIDDGLWQ